MGLPIKWGGSDPFTHMLVVGATRSGKTATILKPMIYQLLMAKKKGKELGLSVVEPKGDVAMMVAEMAEEMGLDYTHIDPTLENSAKFNPMEGETDDVAEATVIVLKGLFGKQDAFFATVQELSARNVTKLLKELHGDDMDITDVMNTLRDPNVLKQKVAELKRRDGETDLVHFFESELLGSMADKYRQFVIGLRAQLENIVSNDALRRIMTDKSDINIDKHFSEGGILAVNTALGMLRSSGDAFGQFVIMHLQNGTFRRPGTEDTRVPHFLIVDEYSRYINPDVEIFLSLAAEYRVAGIFATQTLGQLELESGKISALAMKRSILANCRNKIVFGGVGMEDAKEFADSFGTDKIVMRQSTYKNRILLPNMFPDSFRDTESEEYRFDPTDILDGLPRFTYVHQLMQDGVLQKPGLGLGSFVPRDWKELREWETPEKESPFKDRIIDMFNRIRSKMDRKKKITSTEKNVHDLTKEEYKELEAEADKEEESYKESEEKERDEIDTPVTPKQDVEVEETKESPQIKEKEVFDPFAIPEPEKDRNSKKEDVFDPFADEMPKPKKEKKPKEVIEKPKENSVEVDEEKVEVKEKSKKKEVVETDVVLPLPDKEIEEDEDDKKEEVIEKDEKEPSEKDESSDEINLHDLIGDSDEDDEVIVAEEEKKEKESRIVKRMPNFQGDTFSSEDNFW